MDQPTSASVEYFKRQLDVAMEPIIEGPAIKKSCQLIEELSETLGCPYSISLNVTVEICDGDKSLPILQTGLTSSHGRTAFRTRNDFSLRRYLVNGEIRVVPTGRCPGCWAIWDPKTKSHCCEGCDLCMGGNCRILLDSGICPSCEQGCVAIAKPVCDRCGYRVDLSLAAWG
jgi:hypothetical protein